MPPLLLDISAVSEAACDCCLEDLFKALSEPREPDIWRPHENPWIRETVEAATKRWQALIQAVQDTLARLMTGEPIGALQKAEAEWERLTDARMAEIMARLEAKPPGQYSLRDWLDACDIIISRYLGHDVVLSQADYLTVRGTIAGKILANMAERGPSNAEIAGIVGAIPDRFEAVPPSLLSPVETEILAFARERAAENISDLVSSTRHRMKQIIIRHVEQQVLGTIGGTAADMRQEIFDTFGQLNRDFRRIAVSESGECCNQGFIAGQRPGQQVRRTEAYRGACDFCRSINGKVFTVVAADALEKDGNTSVWVGKTNIGRSASPRKRVGAALVERQPSERWWVAAGIMHPHCRGSWTPVSDYRPEVSQGFRDWLESAIKRATNIPESTGA